MGSTRDREIEQCAADGGGRGGVLPGDQLDELRQYWESTASSVITDLPIVRAYAALQVAIHNELQWPAIGRSYSDNIAALQSGSSEAGEQFAAGLGDVMWMLREFRSRVEEAVTALQRSTPVLGSVLAKARKRRAPLARRSGGL